ncbi:M9 family metallopeptidase [Kitasatospora purpeofusca]|uniref:microbial collagenase n=1 Tax=Kitasatospora purpeofusca TaxID=67352 RepID=A0ABZ1UBA1_9ACTN|nr:collagenase [Kitasatospora purpeofusca]
MRPSRINTANARKLPALGAAFFIALGLFAPQAQAAPAGASTPAGTSASAATPRSIPVPKSPDAKSTSAYKISAQDSTTEHAPPAAPVTAPVKAAKQFSAAAAGDPCPDLSGVLNASGSSLVQQLKALPRVDCTWPLFNINVATSGSAFREANMVTVANALRDAAPAYPGDNSTSIGQLVLFLRAGYYLHETNPTAIGSYGPTLAAATRAGLDAFFANNHSKDATTANGDLLVEVVKVIGQTDTLGRYAGFFKWLLNSYTGTWPERMTATVAEFDWVLKDGFAAADDSKGWKAALKADPSILNSWSGFITRNDSLLNRFDIVSNIGRYLGYALQVPELKPQLRPIMKDLINRYPNVGPTAPITMNLGWATREFDKGHCADFGICDLNTRLMPVILPIQKVCNDGLKIKAQDMSTAQLDSTCTSLINQDAYFHKIIGDKGAIPGDVNTNLEVVAFDDYDQYSLYAWAFYDIDVDNGGMYEEGDPSKAGNQARFIAHEASWLRPDFSIWNLNHEYTHYLDGRYNMAGDFEAGIVTPTIWWVEGIAENISYGYRNMRNADAIAEAGKKTYKLSELFDTVYDQTADADANSNRVYRWGWLATRYMLQQHRADMDAVLAKYRAGDWNGARTILKTTIGTRYDADFSTWLGACASNDCGPLPEAPTGPVAPTIALCTIPDTRQFDNNCRRDNLAASAGNYSYHFINLPAGVKTLTLTSSGGTGNADLYYGGSSWATTSNFLAKSTNAGNGETLTITNPPAGWVYFSLAAQQDFAGTTLSVQYQ